MTSTTSALPSPPSTSAGGDARIDVGRDAVGNVFVAGTENDVRVTLVVADSRLLAQLRAELPKSDVSYNPYRGLDAFYESDAAYFFGRKDLTRRAWVAFQSLQRGPNARILPVVGASGSGKSSLIRAGLLPQLAREPMEGLRHPQVLVLRPGADPLEQLSKVLRQIGGNAAIEPSAFKAAGVDGDFGHLHRQLQFLRPNNSSRYIIFADQFEELYTECLDGDDRNYFLENLAFAASEPDKLVSVVITLRNDFAGAVQKPSAFARAVRENRLLVQAMGREDLSDAIVGPARKMALPWPAVLVENLIAQAEGRAGALPLLQFALQQLWPAHATGTLDETEWASRLIEDFLVEAADRLFEQAGLADTSGRDQRIIKRTFIAMVQLGEGTPDTRRVARSSEVVACADTTEHVAKVLAPFAQPEARLITTSEQTGEATYELTHEALIASWDLLRAWLGNVPDKAEGEKIREALRLRRRLASAAAEWNANRGGLWRPPELDTLRQYVAIDRVDLTPGETTFFDASESAWQAELNRNAHNVMFRRAGVFTFIIFATLVAGGGWFAAKQEGSLRQEAVKQKDLAEQQRANAEAQRNLAEQQKNLAIFSAGAMKKLSAAAFAKAEELADLAKQAIATNSVPDQVHVYDQFALFHNDAGDRLTAEDELKRASELLEKSPDDLSKASHLETIGDVIGNDAGTDAWISTYATAAHLFAHAQHSSDVVRVLAKLARAETVTGRYDEAWKAINRASELAKTPSGGSESSFLEWVRGGTYAAQGNKPQALDCYNKAILGFDATLAVAPRNDRIRLLLGEGLQTRGDLERTESPSVAYDSYVRAIATLEPVLADDPTLFDSSRVIELARVGLRDLGRSDDYIHKVRADDDSIARRFDHDFGDGIGNFKFGSSLTEINDLLSPPFNTANFGNLPRAGEYVTGDVRYFWRNLNQAPEFPSIYPWPSCVRDGGYVLFMFNQGKLFRILVRFLAGPTPCPQMQQAVDMIASAYGIAASGAASERRIRYETNRVGLIASSNQSVVSLEFEER